MSSKENVQYFESKSFVLRIMNLVTRPPSSLSFFSLSAFTASEASASRPRMIAFSKFLRKSFFDPRKLGLAKFSREKYSERSFYGAFIVSLNTISAIMASHTWMGVPDRITRRFTFKAFSATKVRESTNKCEHHDGYAGTMMPYPSS